MCLGVFRLWVSVYWLSERRRDGLVATWAESSDILGDRSRDIQLVEHNDPLRSKRLHKMKSCDPECGLNRNCSAVVRFWDQDADHCHLCVWVFTSAHVQFSIFFSLTEQFLLFYMKSRTLTNQWPPSLEADPALAEVNILSLHTDQ